MNIIIVSYPVGSGGKCIINCLGLSNSATIMDHKLAYSSTEQKSDYFKSQFSETLKTSRWNDLGLKSTKFVGLSLDNDNGSFTPSELGQVYGELEICDEFKSLLNGHKDVYMVAHSADATLFYKKFYKSSTVIRLINPADIVYKRNPIIGIPEETFCKLCNNTEQTIGEFIAWDCKWFENQDIFLKNMENLYIKLGYTDFDIVQTHIRKYYSYWSKIVYLVK